MDIQGIAAILTALAVSTGAVWSVVNGRKQRARDETSGLWDEAMDIIARLREENERLRDENTSLKTSREAARRRTVRSRSVPGGNP